MKFARRKQFFSFLNLSLPTSPLSDRSMRPTSKRTLDLLPCTSPGQSFCTDRKNLHCHFSYVPIIAEPRLDFGFCGSQLLQSFPKTSVTCHSQICTSRQVEGKFFLVCTRASHHENIWGRGDVTTRILNLATRWRSLVSFMPRPFYPRGKIRRFPFVRKQVVPRADQDAMQKREISQPCWELNPDSKAIQLIVQSRYRLSCRRCFQVRNPNKTSLGTLFSFWFGFLTIVPCGVSQTHQF